MPWDREGRASSSGETARPPGSPAGPLRIQGTLSDWTGSEGWPRGHLLGAWGSAPGPQPASRPPPPAGQVARGTRLSVQSGVLFSQWMPLKPAGQVQV